MQTRLKVYFYESSNLSEMKTEIFLKTVNKEKVVKKNSNKARITLENNEDFTDKVLNLCEFEVNKNLNNGRDGKKEVERFKSC